MKRELNLDITTNESDTRARLDLKAIGDRIRFIRENVLNKKQKEFAAMIRVGHESTVSRLETGQQSPDAINLNAIAEVAGCDIEWVATGVGRGPRDAKTKEGISHMLALDGSWLQSRYSITACDVMLTHCRTDTYSPLLCNRDIIAVNLKCTTVQGEGFYLVKHPDSESCLRKIVPLTDKLIRMYVGKSDCSHYDVVLTEYIKANKIIGKVILVIHQL